MRGLGPQFLHFADTRLALSHVPSFADLLHQVKLYDLLIHSVEGSPTAPATLLIMTMAVSRLPKIKVVAHTVVILIGVSSLEDVLIQMVGVAGANPIFPSVKSVGVSIMPINAHSFFRLENLRLLLTLSWSCIISERNSDWNVDFGTSAHMTPK